MEGAALALVLSVELSRVSDSLESTPGDLLLLLLLLLVLLVLLL